MSREKTACARCGKIVSHKANGIPVYHLAFETVCGITTRQQCLASYTGATVKRIFSGSSVPRETAKPDALTRRAIREDREFEKFGSLSLIKVDTFIECYAGAAKHGYTFHESELRETAPDAYRGSGIKLSAIWHKLSRETRGLIVADINATNGDEAQADPLAQCQSSSRKNLHTGADVHICTARARFRVTGYGVTRLACSRHVKSAERSNVRKAETDRVLRREPSAPPYLIETI